MQTRPGPVVVGVDGSAAARVAARLGAFEAAHRGVPLELVLVLPWREPAPDRTPPGVDLAAMVHTAATLILEATADHAQRAVPGVPVTTSVIEGHPADVLTARADGASLLCVGSRSGGPVTDLVLGSVAATVVRHAPCPVLVVPLRHVASVTGRRSVVVGLDGEPGSETVAGFALAEAAARGTDLLAVHTWQHTFPGHAHLLLDPLIDPVTAQRREEDLLSDTLQAVVPGAPEVEVRRVVEQARPADALVAASLTAELLVVGHRHRAAGALGSLGSVTSAVLHAAGCPVVVVPLPRAAAPAREPVTSATARP